MDFRHTMAVGLTLLGLLALVAKPKMDISITEYGAVTDARTLNTGAIQRAIDDCASHGGGVVRIPRGIFLTGGVMLRSHVSLRFEDGAVLRGSSDCKDYGGKSLWSDALLKGVDLEDVRLMGPGTLDGADCKNPAGEEGFRGPHAVWLERCKKVTVDGLHVMRSANWAFNCNFCSEVTVKKLSVFGGHDGFDASNCADFSFQDCDFRSGDDCVAGANNTKFAFERCSFNSSCNAFRFACVDLVIRTCKITGPGEYTHLISGRTNMESAFVHFSPEDRGFSGLEPHSAKWVIEDSTIDGADCLYAYNYRSGLWQTGRPVADIVMRRVAATNLGSGIVVLGDAKRHFSLTLEDVSLSLRNDQSPRPLIDLSSFDSVKITRSKFLGVLDSDKFRLQDGNHIETDTTN